MIYNKIAEYLKERGIKQTFLSKRADITYASISSALRGERKIDVEEYSRICSALGLPVDFFFNRDTSPVSNHSVEPPPPPVASATSQTQ